MEVSLAVTFYSSDLADRSFQVNYSQLAPHVLQANPAHVVEAAPPTIPADAQYFTLQTFKVPFPPEEQWPTPDQKHSDWTKRFLADEIHVGPFKLRICFSACGDGRLSAFISFANERVASIRLKIDTRVLRYGYSDKTIGNVSAAQIPGNGKKMKHAVWNGYWDLARGVDPDYVVISNRGLSSPCLRIDVGTFIGEVYLKSSKLSEWYASEDVKVLETSGRKVEDNMWYDCHFYRPETRERTV
jgi:hypothetical protein